MNKIKLSSAVLVPYIKITDTEKDNKVKSTIKTIIQVPEDVLPPVTPDDRKLAGRPIADYFKAAIKILEDEVGPVYVFTSDMLFLGKIEVLY